MMICQNVQSSLIDFLEGDLATAQQAAVQEHISGCSECRAIYQREKNTKLLLHAKVSRVPASDGLRQNILDQINDPDDVVKEDRRIIHIAFWKPIMAAAAVLLVAVAIFFSANRGDELPQVVREGIDEHLQAVASAQPIEISSSDAVELSNWFKGRLDFPLMVANLKKENANLIGGRSSRLVNRDAACLAYQKDQQIISLFMVKLDDATQTKRAIREMIEKSHEDQKLGVSTFKGQTAVFWLDGDILCTLVSDMDKHALVRLANTARSI